MDGPSVESSVVVVGVASGRLFPGLDRVRRWYNVQRFSCVHDAPQHQLICTMLLSAHRLMTMQRRMFILTTKRKKTHAHTTKK